MAEVSVSRRLDASRPTVARHLDARSIIEMEGTFDVQDVREADDGWLVEASAPGMRAAFEVRPFVDGDVEGYVYEQVGDRGPFESMHTRLALEQAADGTTVTATSTVDLGLPLRSVTDRVAGWKRRGELRRVLDRLAEAVG
ncbi:SRPBCC family protein [Haloarchaeobius sp. HRN-SO-5]|uniref:SRPBCC family protein n=1 Tax=Haloarchaeobius sp. HRN-SO-5 TaxID=3446118 RepID=UPI003EBB8A4E